MLGGLVALLVVAQVCWPLNPYQKIRPHHLYCHLHGRHYPVAALLRSAADLDVVFLLLIPLGLLTMMMIYWFSRLTNKFMVWFLKKTKERR